MMVGSEAGLERGYSGDKGVGERLVKKTRGEVGIRNEAPYLLMRNGVAFLYSPGDKVEYRNDGILPFGTSLRGMMVKGRRGCGNMFAIHCGKYTERPKPLPARSLLNTRFKWK